MKAIAVLVFIGALASLMLLTLLRTYVILDIAQLFNVVYLKDLSFIEGYGVIVVINFITAKIDDKPEEDLSVEEMVEKLVSSIVKPIGGLLVAWGLTYIMYYILT